MPAAAREKSIDELLSPSTSLLRPYQRREWEQEIAHTDSLLAQNAATDKKFLANAQRVRKQNEDRKKLLIAQTPRVVTGEEKDRLVALRSTLLARVQEGAPTRQEQYAKPSQVPIELKDKIRRWHARAKGDLLALKKIDLLLNPDCDDRNLTHTDRYLPDEGRRDGYRSDRYGLFSLSPLAKANYDGIDWSSPEVQAQVHQAIAEGKIRVNYNAKPSDIAHRPVGDVEVTDRGDVLAVTVHRDDKKAAIAQKRREALAKARAVRAMNRAQVETPG